MEVRSCGAVVARAAPEGAQFLLLQYAQGHWDFVKGHVEAGESEVETLRREAREETGITDLRVLPGFRKVIRYSYRHQGQAVRKQVVYFVALTNTEEVRLSHEHTGYVWLPRNKALGKVTFENAKRLLADAAALLEKEGLLAAVNPKDRPRRDPATAKPPKGTLRPPPMG